MMSSHVLARVLILTGLTALIGITVVVHFGTPLGQSVPTEAEAKAPPSVQVVPPGPDGPSAFSPVQDTASPSQPPVTVAARWIMTTGSLAVQTPPAGVLAPAPAPPAQPTPATRVEAPAPSTWSDPKRVNINSARVDQLKRLGGQFGKAIIRGLPYGSIDELVSKRILKRAVFNRIKSQLAAH